MTQHQKLKRSEVLRDIGEQAKGAEISKLKVTKKRSQVARGLAFGSKVCIILELGRRVVGYRIFNNESKDKVNEYIHLFFSSGQVQEED